MTVKFFFSLATFTAVPQENLSDADTCIKKTKDDGQISAYNQMSVPTIPYKCSISPLYFLNFPVFYTHLDAKATHPACHQAVKWVCIYSIQIIQTT